MIDDFIDIFSIEFSIALISTMAITAINVINLIDFQFDVILIISCNQLCIIVRKWNVNRSSNP